MLPSIHVFCAILAVGAFVPAAAQVPDSLTTDSGARVRSSPLVTDSVYTAPQQSAAEVRFNASHGSGIGQGRSMKTVAIATVLGAGLVVPFDRQVASRARTLSASESRLNSTASTLNWIGGPGSVILPMTVATIGLVTRQPEVKDIGVHATESVLLSAGVTTILKGVVGRTRPELPTLDADDFTFRAGFKRNTATSFPSGHTTAAFALATTLTLETARAHPKAKWLVGLSSFGVASGVGLARVYSDRHWSSDVIVGAGIGTLTGILLDRVIHHNPEGRYGLLNRLH